MPTYDYTCNKCNYSFEKLLKISDMDKPCTEPCPDCQSKDTIEKIIGAPKVCDSMTIGVKQPSSEFKQAMKNVADAHPLANKLPKY